MLKQPKNSATTANVASRRAAEQLGKPTSGYRDSWPKATEAFVFFIRVLGDFERGGKVNLNSSTAGKGRMVTQLDGSLQLRDVTSTSLTSEVG